ncbi:MAG: hypothetical protein QM765_44795 [Myxococcales bacterium]
MNDNELPVSVQVRRPDGSVEAVRVGTAVKSGDGYVLNLQLVIGGEGAAPARASAPRSSAAPARTTAAPSGPMPTIFPPYGRSKGMPIAGASRGDLEYYANGARRSLSDPSKARFHDKERALLAAIEAEMARQGGGGGGGGSDFGDEPPPPGDHDMPPPDEY